MRKSFRLETTSMFLHIAAMILMLCDHLWATVIPGNNWLTCIGRIAFPIFAFLIVEGYFHTRNFKKYILRLLVFALLSEIPFDLVAGGTPFYPFHQNVLWSFLISLGLIHMNERARHTGKWSLRILTAAVTVLCGSVAGLLTMVDYYHAGILTVLAFYFFRGRRWWHFPLQLISLAYINLELLGGLGYELSLFGQNFFFKQQGFALLALIPIWLHRGQQGPHSKSLQFLYYAFYPAHLLILGLLRLL